MQTTKIIAAAAVAAALAATPAAAPAAPNCADSGDHCRIALNHNEVLAAS
jgi:hypothetical protein